MNIFGNKLCNSYSVTNEMKSLLCKIFSMCVFEIQINFCRRAQMWYSLKRFILRSNFSKHNFISLVLGILAKTFLLEKRKSNHKIDLNIFETNLRWCGLYWVLFFLWCLISWHCMCWQRQRRMKLQSILSKTWNPSLRSMTRDLNCFLSFVVFATLFHIIVNGILLLT